MGIQSDLHELPVPGKGTDLLLVHAGGHAGYEIAPFIPSLEAIIVGLLQWVHPSRGDLSGALNTVQHHDMHHRYPTHHFSLYFTHWDRWCGTEHPAYYKQVWLLLLSCPLDLAGCPASNSYQEICRFFAREKCHMSHALLVLVWRLCVCVTCLAF